MNKSDLAINKFNEGYNCAQAVLFSLSEYTGITEDYSLRIATGFGAGMGRTQHVCGAVSGGILAINHLFGRGINDGKEKQEDVYFKVKLLIDEFEKQHNTVTCKELLDGCNLLSKEGQERFNSEKMIDKCSCYISSVVNILEEILKKN